MIGIHVKISINKYKQEYTVTIQILPFWHFMHCQIFLMKFFRYFENSNADNGLLPFQLHSHDNPQKHLVIPQFEDSLTTKKQMPFSTYSLVIFSTKRKGRTHMNICTTKVHNCSVPRLDQNYSFNFFVVLMKILLH